MLTFVVPVKSFRAGKGRLADDIGEAERHALATRFANHVSRVAEAAGFDLVIVTADEEVQQWADDQGIDVAIDSGTGLNAAATTGIDWCDARQRRWVILHSDLPLLRPGDLETLAGAIREGHDVIAPSSDGGTSALGAHHRFAPNYGPGSFSSHLALLTDPVVVTSRGLLHDVDTTVDLASLRRIEPGWTIKS